MESREFLAVCKAKIADYVNDHIDKTDQKHLTINDVYVVWYAKTLQNHKALLSFSLFLNFCFCCHFYQPFYVKFNCYFLIFNTSINLPCYRQSLFLFCQASPTQSDLFHCYATDRFRLIFRNQATFPRCP